jgi:cell wall assembly regulator SMI1
MQNIKQEVLAMLPLLPLAPEDKLPGGATAEQIQLLQKYFDLQLPTQLVEWLGCCNGPCVAQGGVFGVRPDRTFLDIINYAKQHPHWQQNHWLPIGGDGCGNYYVLALDPSNADSCPVFFIDHEADYDELSHQVAPDLWHFLHWLFKDELKLKN